MWPFKSRKNRAAPTGPQRALRVVGHTGDPWGSLDPNWLPEISPRAAESVAAVGAAISAISSTLASLPARIVRADEQRDEIESHDLARLIRDGVNDNEDWPGFIETLVSGCLLNGNAVAAIGTDSRGRLASLTTLPWVGVRVRITESGVLLFDTRATTPPGERRTYARPDVLLLRDRSDTGLLAPSRLQRAAGAMSYAISIQRTAQGFSANLARPGGVLSSPGNMGDDQKTRLKQEWDAAFGSGAEKGRTAVLTGGMTWQGMTLMSAEDAQLVEARAWSVGDIARIFGVSPWLLGDSSRMTFASAREALRTFSMLTLQPWANRVSAAFQASVLAPQYRLQFDIASLAKADTEAHFAALLRGRQGGWLSPNDARFESGWPRSEEPGANSIRPPEAGGRSPTADAAGGADASSPSPAASDDQGDAAKIARLDQHRAR